MRLALCALRVDMHIPLRKGNDNTFSIKFLVDHTVQFVDNPAFVMWSVGPTEQFEIQGRIAEGAKSYTWLRFGRDQRIIMGRFEQNLLPK